MTDPSPAGVRTTLRSIAAWSSPSDRPSIGATPPIEEALLAGIGRERLTGLALAAVDAGALCLSAAGVDELRVRHEHQLALDLQLERVLDRECHRYSTAKASRIGR